MLVTCSVHLFPFLTLNSHVCVNYLIILSPKEFQTLIKGGAALDLNAVQAKPASWILDITWLNIISLSELHQFNDLPAKVRI